MADPIGQTVLHGARKEINPQNVEVVKRKGMRVLESSKVGLDVAVRQILKAWSRRRVWPICPNEDDWQSSHRFAGLNRVLFWRRMFVKDADYVRFGVWDVHLIVARVARWGLLSFVELMHLAHERNVVHIAIECAFQEIWCRSTIFRRHQAAIDVALRVHVLDARLPCLIVRSAGRIVRECSVPFDRAWIQQPSRRELVVYEWVMVNKCLER